MEELEERAIHLIGPTERRLFLMDVDGLYWVRSDMTSAEADLVADTLASWFYHAHEEVPLGVFAAKRLYDDGQVIDR